MLWIQPVDAKQLNSVQAEGVLQIIEQLRQTHTTSQCFHRQARESRRITSELCDMTP
ncbi:hypothetical protein EMIT0P258_160025 [Pseudomonas sp. IT-P258]